MNLAKKIGATTISHSGWHVYNNMEHMLDRNIAAEYSCQSDSEEYGKTVELHKHMLPKTDAILDRSINIKSSDEEIAKTVEDIQSIMIKINNK